MTIPENHLAQEAIAALVDGELAPGPAHRAAKHLFGCLQCRMAVEEPREAKEALHASCDVAVPGELLSRLQAIPFTAEVPGSSGTLAAGPDQLTLSGPSGSWAMSLGPQDTAHRADQARWLRRGVAGTAAALGVGVLALALNLPSGGTTSSPARPVVRSAVPEEHSTIVPPVVRTVTVGTRAALPGRAVDGTP